MRQGGARSLGEQAGHGDFLSGSWSTGVRARLAGGPGHAQGDVRGGGVAARAGARRLPDLVSAAGGGQNRGGEHQGQGDAASRHGGDELLHNC
mmetsp:Transcript_24181/g.69327  ORF Transcript_24181/g.69327 Transcript_24181/m.69327 type:complete len:93 (-) Transcript_24181:38-316(-)